MYYQIIFTLYDLLVRYKLKFSRSMHGVIEHVVVVDKEIIYWKRIRPSLSQKLVQGG